VRGQTYSWLVRAVYAGGYAYADNGTWWSFSTAPILPWKAGPANGATGVSLTPTLSWTTTNPGGTDFQYCLDTTPGTTCDGTWTSVGPALNVTPGTLAGNTTYYWHVRSLYAGVYVYSDGDTWWSFTTQP
jgi:hypothetical protein